MTLRDDLLPLIAELRQLPSDYGLRRYSVTLRRRVWTGGEPGSGQAMVTDLELLPRPKVREVTTREVADSGGTWRSGDFKVDRITPKSPSAGYTPEQLMLKPAGDDEDVAVILVGDEGTFECEVVEAHFERPFTYSMVVRKTVINR